MLRRWLLSAARLEAAHHTDLGCMCAMRSRRSALEGLSWAYVGTMARCKHFAHTGDVQRAHDIRAPSCCCRPCWQLMPCQRHHTWATACAAQSIAGTTNAMGARTQGGGPGEDEADHAGLRESTSGARTHAAYSPRRVSSSRFERMRRRRTTLSGPALLWPGWLVHIVL